MTWFGDLWCWYFHSRRTTVQVFSTETNVFSEIRCDDCGRHWVQSSAGLRWCQYGPTNPPPIKGGAEMQMLWEVLVQEMEQNARSNQVIRLISGRDKPSVGVA